MGGRPHLSHILPLPSQRLGRYQIILLGDRGTWVWTTCPELLLGSGLAGSRTRDLSITSQRPTHWATEIFSIQHFIVRCDKKNVQHKKSIEWDVKDNVNNELWLLVLGNTASLLLRTLCINVKNNFVLLSSLMFYFMFHFRQLSVLFYSFYF